MSHVNIPVPSAAVASIADDTLKFAAMAGGSALFKQLVLGQPQDAKEVALTVAGMGVGFAIFHYLLRNRVSFRVPMPVASVQPAPEQASESMAAYRSSAKDRRRR